MTVTVYLLIEEFLKIQIEGSAQGSLNRYSFDERHQCELVIVQVPHAAITEVQEDLMCKVIFVS